MNGKNSLFLALMLSVNAMATTRITDVRTLGLRNPMGIESNPTFSWKIDSDQRGYRQKAYEITVMDEDGEAVWSSGRVESSRQTDVPYGGPALSSRKRYTWTVVTYDSAGGSSEEGKGSFETALLQPDEWKPAAWIAPKKRSYKARVEIVPKQVGTRARFVKLDVTASGPHASSDPNYGFVQIAEIEIYDKDGNNVARNATFKASNAWELANYGWSVNYLNDGIISGGKTNGFTTTQNTTSTVIVADLGSAVDISRVVLYPRQDAPAINDAEHAANFPSSYSVAMGVDGKAYDVQYEVRNAPAPVYEGDELVPYIGCNFQVDNGKTVKRARLYASALGVFTMRMNGQMVTDNVLEPGESAYDKHVLYSTYDVTKFVQAGRNALIAQVAGGIANMSKMGDRFVKPELASNAATTSLRAMLYITYEDGTEQCVPTDDTWGTHASPTTASNWYGGEDYDARREVQGMMDAGYDLSGWERCETVAPTFCAPSVSNTVYPIGQMRAREYDALQVVESWPAKSVTKNAVGNYLVDFGQNFAGTYEFHLNAPAGTKITLYDSELQENGACKFEYMYEPKGATNKTLDTYIFKGDPLGETWGPEFMYHGFRYLEISGLTEAPEPSNFTAKRIRSAMDVMGSFETSNTLLNDIHKMCYHGIESQLYNTVTDCPHREKLGWLDVPNMMYYSLSYNFDVKNLLSKVVMDAFDSQGANHYVPSTVPHFMRAYDDDLNWGGAAITIPWRNYKMYGDKQLMTLYYDKMKALLGYYNSLTENHIIRNYSVLSDWGQQTSGLKQLTSSPFTLTCTYYYLLNAMAEVAQTLGHTDDAQQWIAEAKDVKNAFNNRFYKNGVYEFGNQANYGMALYYGLVDEENIAAVAGALAQSVRNSNYCIKTGEIGLRPTLMALAENGYNDVVYKMAKKTTYPSYGYWLKQGATTSLEYWDMSLSQNHCMMDHIEEWFFACLAGISNAGEAYEVIKIRPWVPADLASLDVKVTTPHGDVRMAWNRTTTNTQYEISVPAGSRANVTLPILKGQELKEGKTKLTALSSVSDVVYADTLVSFTLGSGRYTFTMNGSTLEEEKGNDDDEQEKGTDVTEQYVLNHGFEQKDTNTIPWSPTHWTLSFPDTENAYGKLSTSDQRNVNPSEGMYDWHIWYNTEYVSVRLSQILRLPKGTYNLYGDMRCVDNAAITGCQRLFASVLSEGDTIFSTSYNQDGTISINANNIENYMDWQTLHLCLNVKEESDVVIGYDCPRMNSVGSLGGFQVDNIRLFRQDSPVAISGVQANPKNEQDDYYAITGMKVNGLQHGQVLLCKKSGKMLKVFVR